MLAVLAAIYFTHLDGTALRGEETRRAQVAAEMLWSGDWIVPRQQGEIYLSRPPLGNWLIAISAEIRGQLDRVSVRLPSVIAILLTAAMLYRVARTHFGQMGGLVAAFGYGSMLQVLQLGRTAETEAVLTLCVTAALLGWYEFYRQARPSWQFWIVGYACAACAGLTKGLQGPVYFIVATNGFLILVQREWRRAICWGQCVGVLIFLVIVCFWQIPYLQSAGWSNAKSIWMDQAANRYGQVELLETVRHVLTYPLEVLASTLPWSAVCVQYLNPEVRKRLAPHRGILSFLVFCLLATFPSVWFSPHARARYFMPLYPFIAMLAAAVIPLLKTSPREFWLSRGWQLFRASFFLLGVIATTGIALSFLLPDFSIGMKLRPDSLIIYFLVSISLTGWMFLKILRGKQHSPAQSPLALEIALITLWLGITWAIPVTGIQAARERSISDDVRRLKSDLPNDVVLFSYGRIDHAFTYQFGRLIPARPWPEEDPDADQQHASAGGDSPLWFCARKADLQQHSLPFAWDFVGEYCLSHDPKIHPRKRIVVGRRQMRASTTTP